MIGFLCPVCNEPLQFDKTCYVCLNGHSYDVSKRGYVNLLLNNSASGHGDNKEMLNARRAFLTEGHYKLLADAVCEILLSLCPAFGAVVDIGCGEGYYTQQFFTALQANRTEVIGTDISKEALYLANGAKSGIRYAVCSNKKLPFANGSVDAVTALFTPISEPEIARVLKASGKLILVSPGARHLYGLKEALYETPYLNDEVVLSERFKLSAEKTLSSTLTVAGETLQNLFMMTPYYYKTSKDAQLKLKSLPSVTTELSFCIKVYEPSTSE